MPVYEYVCVCGREREELVPLGRVKLPICHACNRRMKRKVSVPAPFGAANVRTMAERERKGWALATGQRIENARQLDEWAKANGKAIVERGFQAKRVDNTPSEDEVGRMIERYESDKAPVVTTKRAAPRRRKRA